jgi:hypothetical protein
MKRFVNENSDARKSQQKPDGVSADSQHAYRSSIASASALRQPADNIASILRRRAVTASVCGTDAKDRMKRLSRPQMDENGGMPTTASAATTVRKSGSVQDVSVKLSFPGQRVSDSTPLARTQSFQSIAQSASAAAAESKAGVRRTSSSQTMAASSGGARMSAPISATMAFNAELLATFERERRALDSRISELIQVAEFRRTESERLKIELRNQRTDMAVLEEECELLRRDNQAMRERLVELNISVEHFTDSEKLSLLQVRRVGDRTGDVDSKSKLASDGSESVRDAECETALSAGSLDGNWDHGSESALTIGSGSEVSVACLQDRLLAMEETQYSTSEELAATLQELSDLQDAVNSLTSENEKLADERAIVLESLCAQTQKLENARRQIGHLKALLLRDSDTFGERSENERQLAALLRGAEEEREELLLKQAELSNAVAAIDAERQGLKDSSTALADRIQTLELQLGAVASEKRILEAKLHAALEKVDRDDTDLQRYRMLLDGSRVAADDDGTGMLQAGVGTECAPCRQLELMLDTVRKDLAAVVDENGALRERVQLAEKEVDEMRNIADQRTAEMDRRLVIAERESVEARSAADVLRVDIARLTDESKASVARLESELRLARIRATDAEQQATEIAERLEAERNEWMNFQRDLQTAVCVAVDIRTEAQEGAEKLLSENCALRERETTLRREIDSLRAEMSRLRTAQRISDETKSAGLDIRDRVMSTVDRELALLRQQGRRISDVSLPTSTVVGVQPSSLSVRRLISSIEEQVKTESASGSLSRREFPDLMQKSASAALPVVRSVSENSSEMVSPSPVLLRTSPRSSCATISESSVIRNHHHAIDTIDGNLLSATDETKCAVAELAAAAAAVAPSENNKENVVESSKMSLTGILSNKLVKRNMSSGLVIPHLISTCF